jgi:hypothetical protein
MNLDFRKLVFAQEVEELAIIGSVDYELNRAVHEFSVGSSHLSSSYSGGSPPKNMKVIANSASTSSSKPGFNEIRDYVNNYFGEYKWPKVKMENQCVSPEEVKPGEKKGGAPKAITYSPTQNFISNYFSPKAPVKGMLLFQSVGTGKCHAKDTPIIMYDGSIRAVQDIVVGDILMGDDSTPRKVLSLATGQDTMYTIVPVKGDKYTVNSEHILCLKPTTLGINYLKNQTNRPYSVKYINSSGKLNNKSFKTKEEAIEYQTEIQNKKTIVEIEVKDYLKLKDNIKQNLKGYRTGVDFPKQFVNIDPYLIGFWLGDGSKRDPVISTQDSVILMYLRDYCNKNGLLLNHQSQYDYRLSSDGRTTTNTFLESLKDYKLINNKHIPPEFKVNDRETRLALLAGLIDSDGYCDQKGHNYEITQKNTILADDILFLARSLGFAAYKKVCEKYCMYKGESRGGLYNRIHISGDGLDEIPVKLERKKFIGKRSIKKSALVTGITVEYSGPGQYYGFTLDGNNRYLLGDFTVTHNTCTAIAAATKQFEPEGYTILWVTRTTLKNDIWKNMFDQICSESLKNRIQEIPTDPVKQKRMLSDSWSIRPLSYKQFSNLVSQNNDYYRQLVKKNGDEDPLRKTLLIIDEAHKLYGGGDLSSIERPDMAALHKAIMHSYAVSGPDSVRILLMTATPITLDAMEMIKLLNLCRPIEQQLPASFETFQPKFLDDQGHFTGSGKTQFLDEIAGHISYLNREKDARQFSQPIIERVLVPIIENESLIKKFDKASKEDIELSALKEQAEEVADELQGDIREIDTNRFAYMHLHCDKTALPTKKCKQITKKYVRELIKDLKQHKIELKNKLKHLKTEIKKISTNSKTDLKKVRENIKKYPRQYEEFKKTPYYALKTDCSSESKSNREVMEDLKENPVLKKYTDDAEDHEKQIAEMRESLKIYSDSYKIKQRNLKKAYAELRRNSGNSDIDELEKRVLLSTIKDDIKLHKSSEKALKHNISERTEIHKKQIKSLNKTRKNMYNKVKKSLKKMVRIGEKSKKKSRKEEIKLRKIQRAEGEYMEFAQEDLQKITDEKENELKNAIELAEEEYLHKDEKKVEIKMKKKEEKELEKTRKNREKEKERELEKTRKNREKEKKQKERELEKDKKQKERELEKTRKIKERELEKTRKIKEREQKTRKNRDK